jgi:hypothetical protein
MALYVTSPIQPSITNPGIPGQDSKWWPALLVLRFVGWEGGVVVVVNMVFEVTVIVLVLLTGIGSWVVNGVYNEAEGAKSVGGPLYVMLGVAVLLRVKDEVSVVVDWDIMILLIEDHMNLREYCEDKKSAAFEGYQILGKLEMRWPMRLFAVSLLETSTLGANNNLTKIIS